MGVKAEEGFIRIIGRGNKIFEINQQNNGNRSHVRKELMSRIIIKDNLLPSNRLSSTTMFKKFIFSVVSSILSIPDIFFYGLLFASLIIIEYFNFHLNPDTSIQFHTLKNFVNGHGITLTSINENNQIIYLPCSLWPAGLVIFLTPIYLITKSAVMSALILKQIANLFFLLFLSKYFDYLKLESYKRKFIILFFVVSIAPFVEFYVSDVVATVMCLWGFYFFIKYLESEKNKELLFSILLLGICYFVKYSFLPFLFFPAAAFLLKESEAILKKLKQLIVIILITIITALLFYYLNKILVGKMQMQTSLDALKGNPHWNQLTRVDGFLFTFGIYEWVFENLLKNHFDLSIQFNWISILVTGYFYLLFIKLFFKKKHNTNKAFINSLNISISAGALIICFLAFLSINNPGQVWTKPYWTFVQETRYYGPVIIIGLINVLVLFLNTKKGLALHIIVPLMVVLNLYAYRTVIQSGFWGNNYKIYNHTKSGVNQQLNPKRNSNIPIVFFEKDAKDTNPYYYLQSQGVILLDSEKFIGITKNHKENNYLLTVDASKTVNLVKKN
jgi:hypothetical protein